MCQSHTFHIWTLSTDWLLPTVNNTKHRSIWVKMCTQVHEHCPQEASLHSSYWLYCKYKHYRVQKKQTAETTKVPTFYFVYRATRWHVHCTKQNFTKIQLITLDLYHHLQRSLSACTAATENQHATHFDRLHHCSSAPCPPGLLSAISSPFHSSCPSSLPPSASNFDWQGWRWKNSAS